MTFDKFWEKLCDKQPALRDPDGSSVTISVAAFQKNLRQAFKAGTVCQKETDQLARRFGKLGDQVNPFASFLNGLGGL